jgi:hypothetical protein
LPRRHAQRHGERGAERPEERKGEEDDHHMTCFDTNIPTWSRCDARGRLFDVIAQLPARHPAAARTSPR